MVYHKTDFFFLYSLHTEQTCLGHRILISIATASLYNLQDIYLHDIWYLLSVLLLVFSLCFLGSMTHRFHCEQSQGLILRPSSVIKEGEFRIMLSARIIKTSSDK